MKKEGSRSGPRLSRFSEGRGGKKEWRKHNTIFVSKKSIVGFSIDRSLPITRVFHTRFVGEELLEFHARLEKMDGRESNEEV